MSTITLTVSNAMNGSNVGSLREILERHQGLHDHLSISLYEWGSETMLDLVSHQSDSVEDLTNRAVERIRILANEVLVNPLTELPLQDPVVDRLWTWERSSFDDCQRLFSYSPLDGGAMSLFPLPHLFAGEMLEWLHSLSDSKIIQEEGLSSGREIVPFPNSPQYATLRRFYYKQLAQGAISRENNREFRKAIEDSWNQFDRTIELRQRQDDHAIKAVEDKAKADMEKLEERMELENRTQKEIEETYEKKIANTCAAHTQEKQKREETKAALEKENKKTLTSIDEEGRELNIENEKEIKFLTKQVQLEQEEKQKVFAHLHSELDTENNNLQEIENKLKAELLSIAKDYEEGVKKLEEGLATQTESQEKIKSELHSQLETSFEEHEARRSLMQQDYANKVASLQAQFFQKDSNLQERINQIVNDINQIKSLIYSAKIQEQQNLAEIRIVNNDLSRVYQKIDHLIGEIKNNGVWDPFKHW